MEAEEKEKNSPDQVKEPQDLQKHAAKETKTFLKLLFPERNMSYEIRAFTPREYQRRIFETSKKKNTLVCLPTGTGKTKNAILLAVHLLNEYPGEKVIVLSPTKPLAKQICEESKECTTIEPEAIMLLSGMKKPEERAEIFNRSKIIVATPQTIENDVASKRIVLANVCLLVIDECHRSKQKFANTAVARMYQEQRKNGRILALTASPGATKEKVEEVCKNLFIEDVEMRTEEDEDVVPYIQQKKVEYRKLWLPPSFQKIQAEVKNMYKEQVTTLTPYGLYKPAQYLNKKDLLLLQQRFQHEITKGNSAGYSGVSKVAQAIKMLYLLELIETQTPKAALGYLHKIEAESSKAAKAILNDKRTKNIKANIETLVRTETQHPKMAEIKKIMQEEMQEREDTKTIVFANYRATVDELYGLLKEVEKAKPICLTGQSKGFSQRDQLDLIEKFNRGDYNVLITTSIGEEGISIGSLDLAIFYDQTGSEIRKIQRTGRVGRVKAGKIIHLIAKGTRDEALLWTSIRKETRMHNILGSMKRKMETQARLT